MMLKKFWKPLVVVALSMGLNMSCAEDQAAEEVVQPTEPETPATPPEEPSAVKC